MIKRKHVKMIASCLLSGAFMAGCSGSGYMYGAPESPAVLTSPIKGGLIGAEYGGRYGTIQAATPPRTLLGAMLPGNPGRGLGPQDRLFAEEAGRQAHEAAIGQTTIWSNPQTGNSGSITPIRGGQSTIGSQCRQYHNLVNVKGQIEESYGTACQQQDGSWQVTN